MLQLTEEKTQGDSPNLRRIKGLLDSFLGFGFWAIVLLTSRVQAGRMKRESMQALTSSVILASSRSASPSPPCSQQDLHDAGALWN